MLSLKCDLYTWLHVFQGWCKIHIFKGYNNDVMQYSISQGDCKVDASTVIY